MHETSGQTPGSRPPTGGAGTGVETVASRGPGTTVLSHRGESSIPVRLEPVAPRGHCTTISASEGTQ